MSDLFASGGAQPENSSIVGRLLEEISWEGNARKYRDGGRGKENVLTAEVFYPLAFLPRAAVLGAIVAGAHGANTARRSVLAEVEDTIISVLPGDIQLPNSTIRVQPDALLTSASSYTLVEAKRIRPLDLPDRPTRAGAYRHSAQGRPARSSAAGRSRLPTPGARSQGPWAGGLEDAIAQRLHQVDASLGNELSPEELITLIPDTVAWTTWDEIRDVLTANRLLFSSAPEGLGGTLSRPCDAASRPSTGIAEPHPPRRKHPQLPHCAQFALCVVGASTVDQ